MSYYTVLGFKKEPFSTSPDPEFFYQSAEHKAALTNILIEVRLKRGLSVVLGDIGTGKTTLSRKLFQVLGTRKDLDYYMILDPSFDKEDMFLLSLVKTLGIETKSDNVNILDLKEAIKRFLFQKGVNEKKTIVLLIDEAQKLNSMSLEVLRMLLNYETSEFKLLQLVLLGQIELLPRLIDIKNFMDRVSLRYTLTPFDEEDTKEMIKFRIRKAGYEGGVELFSDDGIKEIFQYTQGYPRRIGMLCHKALKFLVMKNKAIVTGDIVKEVINSEVRLGWQTKDLLLKSNC